MKVFVTGAAGYVGRNIVRSLRSGGHHVRCLVRSGSLKKKCENLEVVTGDIEVPDSLSGTMEGCDAVIHLTGIIREFPRQGVTFRGVHVLGTMNVIAEARKAGVRRFELMSANGARPDAPTEYWRTKWIAETAVRDSGFEWTVFRPSVIFGNEEPGITNFISVLDGLLKALPLIIPVPGNGEHRLQPVHVRNVAEGFVRALVCPAALGKTYEVGGPDIYTINRMIGLLRAVRGTRKVAYHQPTTILRVFATLFDRFRAFPVSREQLTMLGTDNVTPQNGQFFDDLNLVPLSFEKGIHEAYAANKP